MFVRCYSFFDIFSKIKIAVTLDFIKKNEIGMTGLEPASNFEKYRKKGASSTSSWFVLKIVLKSKGSEPHISNAVLPLLYLNNTPVYL